MSNEAHLWRTSFVFKARQEEGMAHMHYLLTPAGPSGAHRLNGSFLQHNAALVSLYGRRPGTGDA